MDIRGNRRQPELGLEVCLLLFAEYTTDKSGEGGFLVGSSGRVETGAGGDRAGNKPLDTGDMDDIGANIQREWERNLLHWGIYDSDLAVS